MWLGLGNSIHVVSVRASEDVRTYVPPALCLGTPVPRQKGQKLTVVSGGFNEVDEG